ncbi:hypothetical protein D6C88_02081 [Aureobasidium pullulans]|nr:hypothetical protein D6C88_02081 [Aureobasidium pullulans]
MGDTTAALVWGIPVRISDLLCSVDAFHKAIPTIQTLRLCNQFGQGEDARITKLPKELIGFIEEELLAIHRQEEESRNVGWAQTYRCFEGSCRASRHSFEMDPSIVDAALEELYEEHPEWLHMDEETVHPKEFDELLEAKLDEKRDEYYEDVSYDLCFDNISMYTAFQKLDLHPYHMVEAIKMPARDLAIAVEAIDARNTERAYGIAEFDKWIGDYDSVCDTPMNLLVKELIEAYPEAKVILTTRDPAKWRKSIENSILIIDKWRVWGYLPLISPDCAAFIKMMHKMDEVMDGYSIAALNRHNAGIREVVPKEKLLEFTLGEDGWKELCEFIELPQPEGEFPNVNDGKLFATMHVVLINIWVIKALKDAAVRVAPWAILLGSMWFVKRLGYF